MADEKRADTLFELIAIEKHYGGYLPAIKGVMQGGTRLCDLVKEFDDRSVAMIVIRLIVDFCKEFNVSKNMNEGQCATLAIEIVTDTVEARKWTIEELALFFKKAKTGEYGTPFDRIDRGVINTMMDKYFESDRTTALHQIYEERDNQWKQKNVPLERSTPTMPISEINQKYNGTSASSVHIPGITDNQKIYKDGNTGTTQ